MQFDPQSPDPDSSWRNFSTVGEVGTSTTAMHVAGRTPLGTPEPRVVGPGFNARVYAQVAQVPRGRVSTYGDIATLLGSPRVARQVGYALAALTDPGVPWHRIINARGAISLKGDVVRAVDQRRRLEQEGVVFTDSGLIDLKRFRWVGPEPVAAP